MGTEADPLQLAQLYLSIDKPKKALDALQRADPSDARTYAVAGEALLRLGRWADSERQLRHGLELDPESVGLLLLLAHAQLRRDAGAAEQTIRIAHALDPESAQVLSTYVLILMEQGRYEAAETILERAMAIAPDEMHAVRTLLLLKASTSADALDAAQQMLRREPDDAGAHYLQGLALLKRGHVAAATGHLREAARLNPGVPLFPAAARTLGAWYLWPVHVTGGDRHIVISAVVVVGALMATFLVEDVSGAWLVAWPWVAFVAYKWIAVGISAFLLHRRARGS